MRVFRSMHDLVQAYADALACTAETEEEMAGQLAEMGREACKLGHHELKASLLRIARAHRAAAIRHRAERSSLLYHQSTVSMDDEESGSI